jgi:uncharacterized protein YoxC
MSLSAELYSEKYMKKVIGRTDIEDVLKRLDKLTQEEARMATAENLKATHAVGENVRGVADKVEAVDNRVAGVGDTVASVGNTVSAMVAGVGDRVRVVDDRVAEVVRGA